MRRTGLNWLGSFGQVVLVVGLLFGLSLANYRLAVQAHGGNDFVARWVAANQWLVNGLDPYSPQVSLEAQTLIYGRPAERESGEDVAHFAYPLFTMLFFGPFGLIPYPLARALWMTLLEVTLPLLAMIGLKLAQWRPSSWLQRILILFSLLWFPGFRAVILGQFAVIEALLIAGALLATQRRQDPLAGILIGLSLAMPQMAVLVVPFVFLWALAARRLSLLGWGFGTIAFLVAAPLALIPDWPLQWARQLFDYASYTAMDPPLVRAAELIPGEPRMIPAILILVGLVYLISECWRALRKGDRWFQWSAALSITINSLVVPFIRPSEFIVLFPSLCYVFGLAARRWDRLGQVRAALGLAALLAVGWIVVAVVNRPNGPALAAELLLPICTLAALLWMRWWSTRPFGSGISAEP